MKNYGFSLTLVAAMTAAAPALAQRTSYASQATQGYGNSSSTGGRLPFTQSNGMGGGYGQGMGMSSPFGQSGFGSSSMGMGMGSGFGNTGTMSPFGQTGLNSSQSGLGNTRGGGQQFQQGGFVGRDAEDVRTGFQSTGRQPGRGNALDQMIESLNDMRESRRRWREQRNTPPPVKVKLIPAIDVPQLSAAKSAPAVQQRVNQMLAAHAMAGAQIQIAGQVATLRGSVNTDHERALAEQLALLEPGVSQVENLLTLTAPQAAP
jgi:hypothetical protein